MATPTAQDYAAFAKSLEGLSSTEQAKAINKAKADLQAQGIAVDTGLEAQYVTPVLQNTLNRNVGLAPTLTGGGSSATVGSGNTGVTAGGGSNVTTGFNLAPNSGAPSLSVGAGTPSVTAGGGTGATTSTSVNTNAFGVPIEQAPADFSGFSQQDIQSYVDQVYAANPGDYFGATARINEDLAKFNQAGYNISFDDVSKAVQSYTQGQTSATEAAGTETGTGAGTETGTGAGTETGTGAGTETGGVTTPAPTYTTFLQDQVINPTLPENAKYVATTQSVQPDELVSYAGLGDAPTTTTAQAAQPATVTSPLATEAPQITNVPTISDEITEMEGVQGRLSDPATIQNVAQGVVSPESIARAAQGKVSKEATVQYQIGELMASIETGQPLPAWASGAARGATAMMQQRGLGASSMASAAMVQSLMEAGIPIAQADAQTYAAMDLANLNARQQTALTNAATYAAMDARNLDARLTAQVNNAKAFLTIDLQNLDNEQKASTLSYQYLTEAMFKDQSYQYAAEQFNAQTQAQVDQFFEELDVQVQTANANRVAAMSQFNAGEANAMSQFTASMKDARDRFDAEMTSQINQANALWRREINTQTTALTNEQNRINTQNLLGLSTNAQNALWQKYADEAAFVFEMAERESNRQHQIGMLAMESKYNTDLYERKFELDGLLEIGKNALKIWSE